MVVAGRDARGAAALAAELGAQRVRGMWLDATDAPSVRRALEGVQLFVNAVVVPRHVAALARTAIAAGTDWTGSTFRFTAARLGSSTVWQTRSPLRDAASSHRRAFTLGAGGTRPLGSTTGR